MPVSSTNQADFTFWWHLATTIVWAKQPQKSSPKDTLCILFQHLFHAFLLPDFYVWHLHKNLVCLLVFCSMFDITVTKFHVIVYLWVWSSEIFDIKRCHNKVDVLVFLWVWSSVRISSVTSSTSCAGTFGKTLEFIFLWTRFPNKSEKLFVKWSGCVLFQKEAQCVFTNGKDQCKLNVVLRQKNMWKKLLQ